MEHPARMDCAGHPIHGALRNACVDQVIGESQRHAEDQQHAADQQPAFRHHAWHVAPEFEIAVHQDFDDESVNRGERGRLDRRSEAAEQAEERDRRQQQLPLGGKQRRACFAPVELGARSPPPAARG